MRAWLRFLRRLLAKYGPTLYVGVFGVEIWSSWGTTSITVLRWAITVLCPVAAYWFVAYRLAERGRRAAQEKTDARALMRATKWMN